jgi:cell division protein FtsB
VVEVKIKEEIDKLDGKYAAIVSSLKGQISKLNSDYEKLKLENEKLKIMVNRDHDIGDSAGR